MGFARFMSSVWGRLLRIVAGIGLIVVGLSLVGGVGGILIAVVGAVPLLAGLLDVCIIGRLLLRTPLKGAELRRRSS